MLNYYSNWVIISKCPWCQSEDLSKDLAIKKRERYFTNIKCKYTKLNIIFYLILNLVLVLEKIRIYFMVYYCLYFRLCIWGTPKSCHVLRAFLNFDTTLHLEPINKYFFSTGDVLFLLQEILCDQTWKGADKC